jgi:hypothetical protein
VREKERERAREREPVREKSDHFYLVQMRFQVAESLIQINSLKSIINRSVKEKYSKIIESKKGVERAQVGSVTSKESRVR